MENENNKYQIIFQKLDEIKTTDSEILETTHSIAQVIESANPVIEELRLLSEASQTYKREEFYTGT